MPSDDKLLPTVAPRTTEKALPTCIPPTTETVVIDGITAIPTTENVEPKLTFLRTEKKKKKLELS